MAKDKLETVPQPAAAAAPTPAPAPAPEARCRYEVRVEHLRVGGVIAYRGASIQLTAAQAAGLQEAQPECVLFQGV